MVESRITNTLFYSNAIPRVPIIDASEAPSENPNTVGDGNVGQPTVAESVTSESPPNITRLAHTRDIFVPLGTQMSISYVADSLCTMLPKGGYEDMVVSYSTDGLTMTLTWNCPNDEPADSTYIGVEVWVHGATATTEAYDVHWDRLHVGKVIGDLKYIGTDTAWPILYTALSTRNDYVAGDTVIITDGSYSDVDDVVGLGYTAQRSYNTNFPNGVATLTADGGESIYVPTKHSNIMAQTPLGVFLDRQNRSGGVHLRGDARTGPNVSNRSTYAVNILGMDCHNHPTGFDLQRADSCSINYSASVVDTNRDETTRAFGDSNNLSKSATRNCNYEMNLSFGNQRLLNVDGYGDSKGIWRGVFGTNGATQTKNERITQTFTGYGASNQDWLNCWAIDDVLYALGIRNTDAGSVPAPNACFITTNAQGHNYYGHGLLTLNTVRAALFSDSPSPANVFKSCSFWQKIEVLNSEGNPMDTRSMIARGQHHFEDITVGKNLCPADQGASIVNCYGAKDSTFDRLLAASPVWDSTAADNFSYGGTDAQFDDLYVISSTSNVNNDLATSSGYVRSTLIPKDLGLHYISRIEEGSVLDLLPVSRGCKDLFSAVGRYGKRYLDASREVYNGTGGLPRVNRMARSPWYEFRTARQRFDCTSNQLNFTGDVGIGSPGVHPVDYVNRFGTHPTTPENCPYIDDIYGVVNGTDVLLCWRPVCAAFRETITSYTILIDNAVYLEDISPTATSITISGVNAGLRRFEIVCVDPTFGNSGKSTPVLLTI